MHVSFKRTGIDHEKSAPKGDAHSGPESALTRAPFANAPAAQPDGEISDGMLERIIAVAAEAAQGNLEARVIHCGGPGKLQHLALSINHLLDMTDAFLREAGATLEHASDGKFFRRVLLRGMRGTFRHKSQLINEATQKMAGNAASLNKVEQLISESALKAQGAVHEANEATAVVKELGIASEKIGGAVKVIAQVAWQTKLLALNARIEASRAGEAGRGFEVVAREVKELAQQAASAAEGISREIAAVRAEVTRTASVIDSVSKTIAQMQEISAAIETAVVEQQNKKN